MMLTPAELLTKVKRVWSKIDAAPIEDMRSMSWISGAESAKAFTGVKPIDVDIDSVGFRAATPLLELPARVAAAYLGTYLISLLDGLEIQEKVGFPTDISTRVHTLTVLMAPGFFTDIASPHLPADCLEVVRDVVALLIAQREPLLLTDGEVARYERLIRSLDRELRERHA